MRIKKKDIDLLEKWDVDMDRIYDYIYIVPTRKKCNDYLWAWYIWRIWDIYKKIEFYDCWNFVDTKQCFICINFDFEDNFWWIKVWSNEWLLKYDYSWRIKIIAKN